MSMSEQDAAKWAAAHGAMQFIKDGMTVGLGTGSTAEKFVSVLAEKVKSENWQIVCVPTSDVTAAQGRSLGLVMDEAYPDFRHIDVTVDGADEIDPAGALTKGGGGALLREKYVASASDKMVVIADTKKLVTALGTTFRLPVEIVAFAWSNTCERLAAFCDKIELRRREGKLFVTDQGNYIADCTFKAINNPAEMQGKLKSLTGVVETGIFPPGLAKIAVVGKSDGSCDILDFTKAK